MGAAKLTAKFMELMESSPEDQLGDNLKKVMKDGNYQMGGVFFNYIPGSLTFCFDQETMHGIFLEIWLDGIVSYQHVQGDITHYQISKI